MMKYREFAEMDRFIVLFFILFSLQKVICEQDNDSPLDEELTQYLRRHSKFSGTIKESAELDPSNLVDDENSENQVFLVPRQNEIQGGQQQPPTQPNNQQPNPNQTPQQPVTQPTSQNQFENPSQNPPNQQTPQQNQFQPNQIPTQPQLQTQPQTQFQSLPQNQPVQNPFQPTQTFPNQNLFAQQPQNGPQPQSNFQQPQPNFQQPFNPNLQQQQPNFQQPFNPNLQQQQPNFQQPFNPNFQQQQPNLQQPFNPNFQQQQPNLQQPFNPNSQLPVNMPQIAGLSLNGPDAQNGFMFIMHQLSAMLNDPTSRDSLMFLMSDLQTLSKDPNFIKLLQAATYRIQQTMKDPSALNSLLTTLVGPDNMNLFRQDLYNGHLPVVTQVHAADNNPLSPLFSLLHGVVNTKADLFKTLFGKFPIIGPMGQAGSNLANAGIQAAEGTISPFISTPGTTVTTVSTPQRFV